MNIVYMVKNVIPYEDCKIIAICSTKELAEEVLYKYDRYVKNISEECLGEIYSKNENGYICVNSHKLNEYREQYLGNWGENVNLLYAQGDVKIEEIVFID